MAPEMQKSYPKVIWRATSKGWAMNADRRSWASYVHLDWRLIWPYLDRDRPLALAIVARAMESRRDTVIFRKTCAATELVTQEPA